MKSDKACTLYWYQLSHVKTFKHSARTNTPTFWTSSGTLRYTAFEACFRQQSSPLLLHRHLRLTDPEITSELEE